MLAKCQPLAGHFLLHRQSFTCYLFLTLISYLPSLNFSRRYLCFMLHTLNTLRILCPCTSALLKSSLPLKISGDGKSPSVPRLTRLMRRLMAYSWLQMHSQGSKPPSAMSHQIVSTLERDKRTVCN